MQYFQGEMLDGLCLVARWMTSELAQRKSQGLTGHYCLLQNITRDQSD